MSRGYLCFTSGDSSTVQGSKILPKYELRTFDSITSNSEQGNAQLASLGGFEPQTYYCTLLTCVPNCEMISSVADFEACLRRVSEDMLVRCFSRMKLGRFVASGAKSLDYSRLLDHKNQVGSIKFDSDENTKLKQYVLILLAFYRSLVRNESTSVDGSLGRVIMQATMPFIERYLFKESSRWHSTSGNIASERNIGGARLPPKGVSKMTKNRTVLDLGTNPADIVAKYNKTVTIQSPDGSGATALPESPPNVLDYFFSSCVGTKSPRRGKDSTLSQLGRGITKNQGATIPPLGLRFEVALVVEFPNEAAAVRFNQLVGTRTRGRSRWAMAQRALSRLSKDAHGDGDENSNTNDGANASEANGDIKNYTNFEAIMGRQWFTAIKLCTAEKTASIICLDSPSSCSPPSGDKK